MGLPAEIDQGDAKIYSPQAYRMCSVTVMDTTVPGITFNEKGESDFCQYYKSLAQRTILRDPAILKSEYKEAIQTIKYEGRKKPYDCILGISGGMDSTYLP